MANTSVSICSNALLKLGDDSITSLTDNTNRARLCNRLFDPVRQSVLRDANWHDSIKRQQLAQSSTAPVVVSGDDAYQYALPSDFMRLVETSVDSVQAKYTIEGKMLVTDEASIAIRYVYDNTDVASYDSLHVEAFTAYLAAQLSLSLTGKASYYDRMWAEWERKKNAANAANGREGKPEEHVSRDLIDVR